MNAGGLLLSVVAISSLLSAMVTGVRAEADGPDYFRVTGVAENDVLNIREAPEAGAAKLGGIPWNGDGIRNLGCQGGLSFAEWEAATEAERRAAAQTRWCRVSYGGIEGWAAGWFLAEGAYPAAETAGSGSPSMWRFGAVDGEPAIGDTEITFGPDGSISGTTGCNRFNGRGEMVEGALVIAGPLATTRMACPGEAITMQEDRILAALQGRLSIGFDPFSQSLQLVNEDAGITLRLDR
jgi:heat shock protein HslJ